MWDAIREVLENLAKDTTNRDKIYVASGLLKQMELFEFVLVFASYWEKLMIYHNACKRKIRTLSAL